MRTTRWLGTMVAPWALVGTLGCTATVADEAADDGPATTTQALVLVERTERVEHDGNTAQTNISAKFLRAPTASDSEVVERIVGSHLDLPAVGECMTVPASEDAGAADDLAASFAVELFDVGDVTIQTARGPVPLAARAFPDVGDRVSGMFYTSPDATRDLPAPGKYILESTGAAVVAPFAVESEAPPAPAEVTVAGHPLGEPIELFEGEPIALGWRVSAAMGEGSQDDVTYVEIVAENGVAVRCAYDDRGRGTLPASLLRSAGFGSLPLGATLAVHRVRQGTFLVPGIDMGEVRFDVSVTAGVTLRAGTRFDPAP